MKRILPFGLAAVLLAAPAFATTISPPIAPNEYSVFEVLDAVYGAGNWVQLSDAADWGFFGTAFIEATAIYSKSNGTQQFGFCQVCDGSDDSAFDPIIDGQTDFPDKPTPLAGTAIPLMFGGMTEVLLPAGFNFWFDNATSTPAVGKVFSNPTLNGNVDFAVGFGILGTMKPTIVWAFEDWLNGAVNPGNDFDFNDLMVEVQFTGVPEPGTVVLFGSALVGLALVRRRRRG